MVDPELKTNESLILSHKFYGPGDYVYLGGQKGNLRKFSLSKNQVVRNMGYVTSIYFANIKMEKLKYGDKGAAAITSFSKSIDNKYLFVCDYDGGVAVIDIYSGDLSFDFNIKNARMSVVTFDNQYLIICQSGFGSGNIEKYSIQSKELVAVLDKYED